jgi:hypothetical protein
MTSARVDLGIYGQDTDLRAKLDSLKASIAEMKSDAGDISIDADDRDAQVKLLDLKAKLDALDRRTAKPSISLTGADRALVDLAKVDLAMDKLNDKTDRSTSAFDRLGEHVESVVDNIRNLFSDISHPGSNRNGKSSISNILGDITHLFGNNNNGNNNGPENAANDAESEGTDWGSLLKGGGISGLIALAGSLAPSVVPLALGGGIGLGGAAGVLETQPGMLTGIEGALETAFKMAVGQPTTPTVGTGPAGLRQGGANTGFTTEIGTMLSQVTGFVKSTGPGLSGMFAASLPFIKMFTTSMEQLAKLLLPAFTQSMKEMKPYLPQMAEGLGSLSQGLADFIKDLGPGMKDSATVFKATADAIKGILIALAFLADGLAFTFANVGHHVAQMASYFHGAFDEIRSDVSTSFDYIRHAVAASWDQTWNDTYGTLVRFSSEAVAKTEQFEHDIAHWFDDIRHDVASAWNSAWSSAIGFTDHAVDSIVRLVESLPGKLFNLGKEAIESLVSGLRSDIGGIGSVISGALNSIPGVSGISNILHHLASGGMITEPILGYGMRTGESYMLGENGPEAVIPTRGTMSAALSQALSSGAASAASRFGNGGDNYYIYPPESATNPHAYALTLVQALRRYRKQNGNQPLGLG